MTPKHWTALTTLTLALALGACTDGSGTSGTGNDSATGQNDSGTTTTPDNLAVTDATAVVNDRTRTLLNVSFTLSDDATTWVTFHTGDDDWVSSPKVDSTAGANETIIVGVTADTEVTWKIMAEAGAAAAESDEQVTTTGSLPSDIPVFDLMENDPSGWTHPYVFGSVGTDAVNQWLLFIVNRAGEMVWYYYLDEGFWAPYSQIAQDNRSILYVARDTPNDDRRIVRMGIDGEIHKEWELDGLTHAFVELEDESVVYVREVGTDEEVTMVKPDGSTQVVWTCSDWLRDTNNPALPCFHNGLNWYPDRGTFLISFYNLNTVAEADIDSGTTIRSFGEVGGSYGFTDAGVSFDFQHHPTWTSRGGLMVTSSDPPRETWAREFEVDEANETITQIWSHGEGYGLEARTIGEATRLDNDNTLMNWGSHPHMREVKLDGTIVWDGYMDGAAFMSRIHPVVDLYDFYCPGCYEQTE